MMIQYQLFSRGRVLPLVALCVCYFCFSAPGNGRANEFDNAPPSIDYLVDLSDARNHYVTVTATVPADGKSTELMMAVWTPGSYLIREYARHIDSMEVKSNAGNPLKFEKIRKNRWRVESKGIKSFSISYRLYCNELSVRTNWLDRQFAIFSGAATFITVPKQLDRPHAVRLKMPIGWTRSATSLKSTGDAPHTYLASNFDELVDSPIVAGNIDVFPFMAGGVEHQLVNIGDTGHWDGTQAATDLKRVVEEHHAMWGVVPYDRYLFLNVICEGRGGLEHDNSTMIMTSRWAFGDKKRYLDWLSLASHEFFHAWNVRRLRPKSLIQYDYENEVYTESLWIAEGITSYYEDLALARAGLFTQKEYLERLSNNIVATQQSNGRQIQSLTDSSYDAWIKFYRPDENSGNTRVSYYSKGAVVAFLLDAKIRKLTHGKKSLDDVMRNMFELYQESGYTADDFRQSANEIAGEDLSEWFRSAVDSTEELEYSDVEWLGLKEPGFEKSVVDDDDGRQEDSKVNSKTSTEVSKSTTKDEKSRSKKPAATEAKDNSSDVKKDQEPKPWLGIRTGSESGKTVVAAVESTSPATAAGLNTGDEIIAINGYRVSASLDDRLKQFKIGDEITLLISRRDQLLELPMVIGTAVERDWKLKSVAKPNRSQKKRLDAWLN